MSCGPRPIYNGLFQSIKVFYGQTNPNLTFLFEITGAVSSRLKRRETFQRVLRVQFNSQHLWWYGVHKCIRYGQLACFERPYEWWNIFKGFRATYAPLQTSVFQQDNAKPHTAAITTAWLCSRRVWVLNWPAVQIFHLLRTFGTSLTEQYVKDGHELLSNWKTISGKNGTKFQHHNSRNS